MAQVVVRYSKKKKNHEVNTWVTDVVFSCKGELRYSLMSSTCIITQKIKRMWFGQSRKFI